jgi:hypothetical protein
MIRSPVHPQLRSASWHQLVDVLDVIERGLTLVLEGIDCGSGQFGLVDGLARDASGAPVLVLAAVDGDGQLAARVHAACEFLSRGGDSLATALPEANLCPGARGRVFVVGIASGDASLQLLRRLPLPGLYVCRVESFRVGGTERFSVQWLGADEAETSNQRQREARSSTTFEVAVERRAAWESLRKLCERIDPAVRLDGDRFSRRVTWHGGLLGQVVSADGELCGVDADGTRRVLADARDVRCFVDAMLRRCARFAGIAFGAAGARNGAATIGEGDTLRQPRGGSLRASLSAARLSQEEYSALGGPTAVAGGAVEGGNVADDVARIVTAESAEWPPPRLTD